MTIICMMPISTNIQNTVLFEQKQLMNNVDRIKQYQDGIGQFFLLVKEFIINKVIDVVITDNTCKSEEFPQEITDVIKKNNLSKYVKIICHNNNIYGARNKGCGLIEQWIYNKDIIKSYDWLIHFEPRQLLKTNSFIETFIKNESNMFTFGDGNNHFNTGLFTINTETLCNYIDSVNLNEMVTKYIGIEHSLFNYFVINKIKTKIQKKMDLLWFEYTNNKHYAHDM